MGTCPSGDLVNLVVDDPGAQVTRLPATQPRDHLRIERPRPGVVLATINRPERRNALTDQLFTDLATLEAVATGAIEPHLMGYAPVLALRALFEKPGTTPSDIDVVECNEAFAAQAVAVVRDAKLDIEKTNPYGGAIALGHPVGATGTAPTLRAAKHLERTDAELAIVTMCIGGGQAFAALLRRA